MAEGGLEEKISVNNPRKLEVDDITKCPECNSAHLEHDYNRGELVCGECGLVLDQDIRSDSPRAFTPEQKEKVEHSGPPSTQLLHDKGLTTEISWKDKDSYGRNIPTRNRAEMHRLRKWQRRIKIANSAEKNRVIALSYLETIASQMQVPRNVRETAAFIYKKAADKNLVRGRSIQGVVAASLYGAHRLCNTPRTLDEISEGTGIGRKEIGRTYRHIARELNFGPNKCMPKDYISRFCCKLKLSHEVQVKALDIIVRAEAKELISGRGYTGVAAAAIYIATILENERRTQKEVAEKAGVTEVTIRNRYKELAEKLEIPLGTI
ncbi:MAG: transcription initiation factor IIB [archaeon]